MKPFMITGEVSWNGIPKLYAVFVGPCRTGPALRPVCSRRFPHVTDASGNTREGIAEYGRIRAERDGRKLAPEDWMNEHYTMMGGVFETEISDTEEYCEMKMHYCPLLEEWKKMGLSPEDQDLFCDVAMELDRNRAKEHGIPCDIVERLGKGDPFCRVVLWKKKKD